MLSNPIRAVKAVIDANYKLDGAAIQWTAGKFAFECLQVGRVPRPTAPGLARDGLEREAGRRASRTCSTCPTWIRLAPLPQPLQGIPVSNEEMGGGPDTVGERLEPVFRRGCGGRSPFRAHAPCSPPPALAGLAPRPLPQRRAHAPWALGPAV
jgi:hypothetical protein